MKQALESLEEVVSASFAWRRITTIDVLTEFAIMDSRTRYWVKLEVRIRFTTPSNVAPPPVSCAKRILPSFRLISATAREARHHLPD
jgi:hypothetical protein